MNDRASLITVLSIPVVLYRPLGYERVYLPPREVTDTPFHIQGDDIFRLKLAQNRMYGRVQATQGLDDAG